MAKLEWIGVTATVAALMLASCSSGGGQTSASERPSSSAAPTTPATTPAPPTAAGLAIGAGDLSGYSAATQPAATPVPCGSKFGDTSASTTKTEVAFATPGNQQTVDETVAIYPSPEAATAVATAFRTAAPSCTQFDDMQGPTTTYQVRPLTLPARTADESFGVALASPAHFYDLVLLRSGARLAWLSLGQTGNPVDADALAAVSTAAAHRLVAP